MGVIAFTLALNLSTMDVFAGKSKYIEEEVSSCGSIFETIKYKEPQKDVRIDIMKEKKTVQLVQNIQRLKTE